MAPPRQFPCLYDAAWISQRYVGEEQTAEEIAAVVGCSPTAVLRALRLAEIPLRRAEVRGRNLVGQRFGRWSVLAPAPRRRYGDHFSRMVKARCDCGNERVVRESAIARGETQSCGCVSGALAAERNRENTRHGHAGEDGSITYHTWQAMKQRCYNPTQDNYSRYGGRGITVCQRWRDSFDAFLADMGERPDGHTIDRIDVDGNYEPSNCRWATATEQRHNRRIRP